MALRSPSTDSLGRLSVRGLGNPPRAAPTFESSTAERIRRRWSGSNEGEDRFGLERTAKAGATSTCTRWNERTVRQERSDRRSSCWLHREDCRMKERRTPNEETLGGLALESCGETDRPRSQVRPHEERLTMRGLCV